MFKIVFLHLQEIKFFKQCHGDLEKFTVCFSWLLATLNLSFSFCFFFLRLPKQFTKACEFPIPYYRCLCIIQVHCYHLPQSFSLSHVPPPRWEPTVLLWDLYLLPARRSLFLSSYNILSKGILKSSNCSTFLDGARVTARPLSTDITDLGVWETLEQSQEVHTVLLDYTLVVLVQAYMELVACSSGWSKWQDQDEKWCLGVRCPGGSASS